MFCAFGVLYYDYIEWDEFLLFWYYGTLALDPDSYSYSYPPLRLLILKD